MMKTESISAQNRESLRQLRRRLVREQRAVSIRKFFRNKLSVVGMVLVLLMLICAVFAPLITGLLGVDPYTATMQERFQAPSAAHLFGTDNLGRGAGGPLAVYFITIVASECGKIVSKETKVDILVTPAVTILVGVGLSVLCAPAIGAAASSVGDFIKWATNLQPLLMGILVSVVVGMALTLPISSAAICAALSLTGLAGGAAVAGCCAQMVGFAVMSFRENGVGGLVSQGLGTSMLQMPNIIRNPRTWIPPTLASAITGPIATCLFHLEMNGPAVSSGMGTCGLVGQIGVYTGWLNDIAAGTKAAIVPMDWVGLILICFVLPAVLTLLFAFFLRKWGWIKDGDLKLQ